MANFIKCPYCNKDISDTSKRCVQCGKPVSISYAQPQQMQQPMYNQMQYQTYQQPVQPQMMQPNMNVTNENLIQCPACFNYMGRYAETCPYCGTPRQKKVANPMLLDALTVFAIAFAIFAFVIHKVVFSMGTTLIFLIIYAIYYGNIKDNKDVDSSKVKQSMVILAVILTIFFLLTVFLNLPLT